MGNFALNKLGNLMYVDDVDLRVYGKVTLGWGCEGRKQAKKWTVK